MPTKGLGFNILEQEEKNKKAKTFVDYAPGHVGDDNYTTIKSTIIPNINTAKANKSGTTVTKEPKQEKWNDRLFLEGFYEVDGTVNDWEREKRISQVETALKDIERRKRKITPGTATRQISAGRVDTAKFQKLPGDPNTPAKITTLPNLPNGRRYPAYTNYANARNNSIVPTSNSTTRAPTKEELEAAYADMQKGFSGQNALQHINDAAEYVKNAATPASSLQSTPTAENKAESRDDYDNRVRKNYAERQQAEADARYENFDIEEAEERLRDEGYWIDRLFERRRQGEGFDADEKVAAEWMALEDEIKRAKEAAEHRRERSLREEVAQKQERNWNTYAVSPQVLRELYPKLQPEEYNGNIPQKRYYTEEKSIYGEHTNEALDVLSNILTAASLIPGIDTLADAAAIPVDLLRGDYISAGLDAIGIIPFIGETADTAKLVRAGINVADAANDAGKVIDAVKAADKADDVADVLKTENNVGELAKPYPKENLPKEVVEWIRKLPQYKDAIEISSTPSYEQISLLSRQEGVEFASITIGNRNIIIRGDTCGTPISKELLEDMIRNKGVLNCHSHPYVGDLQPSKSDLRLAQILSHQEEFEIITPDNMRAVYTKHGIKSVGNIERKLSEHDVLELYKLFGG